MNINSTSFSEIVRADNKKLKDSLESSSESELSVSSDEDIFADRQKEDKLVFRNAKIPDITQRKLKKRFKDVSQQGKPSKQSEVPKLNFRANPHSNRENDHLEINHEQQFFQNPNSVIWVPYVPSDEYDQTQVFDASDPGEFSNMMEMFQSVLSEGRVLTREQIESFASFGGNPHRIERPYPGDNRNSFNPKRTQSLNTKVDRPHVTRRTRDKVRKYSHQYSEKVSKPSKPIPAKINQIPEDEASVCKSGKRSKTPTIDVAVNLNLGNGHLLLNNQKPQRSLRPLNDYQTGIRDSLDLYKSTEETQKDEFGLSDYDKISQVQIPTKPKALRKIKRVGSNPPMLTGPPKELPRSLGPDWVEVEKKAQSLNRRSLYSQFVSVKNSRFVLLMYYITLSSSEVDL